jgi:hypothetical protein
VGGGLRYKTCSPQSRTRSRIQEPTMVHYRSNWRLILAVMLGMATVVARAQQSPALSASVTVAEPTISAPEPSSAPQPLLGSGRNAISTVPPVNHQRVANRQFWALVGITGSCAVLDGESTIHGLQTPGRREMNPMLGSHPDRARFYATVGATDAAFSYLAYRLKRGGHEKLWKMPLLGTSAAHLAGFINNLQY